MVVPGLRSLTDGVCIRSLTRLRRRHHPNRANRDVPQPGAREQSSCCGVNRCRAGGPRLASRPELSRGFERCYLGTRRAPYDYLRGQPEERAMTYLAVRRGGPVTSIFPWTGECSRATCRNKPPTTQRKLFLSAERANYRFFFFAKITFQFSL